MGGKTAEHLNRGSRAVQEYPAKFGTATQEIIITNNS